MLGGFEPTTNMMRNHKIAKALATSSNQHLCKIKKLSEDIATNQIQLDNFFY